MFFRPSDDAEPGEVDVKGEQQDKDAAEDASSLASPDGDALIHTGDETKRDNVFDRRVRVSFDTPTSTQCPGEVVKDAFDDKESCYMPLYDKESLCDKHELKIVSYTGGNIEDSDDELDPNTYGEIVSGQFEDSIRSPAILHSTELNIPYSINQQTNPINQHPYQTLVKFEEEISLEQTQAVHSPESGNQAQATHTSVESDPRENGSFELPSSSRQRKKQRLIPQVVVYTWAALQQRKKEDLKKIKKMNNPKVKKTKDMEFSLSAIYDRLKDIGLDPYEVTLDREIRDRSVSRQFMSNVYGGGSQDTFPDIGAQKLAQHGIKHFMYVNAENHSHAPQFVGNPGFFFNSEPASNWDDLFYVFVRIGPSEWLYVGIYVLLPSPSLSKGEWRSMTEKVRSAWVSLIYKKGWAGAFRLRVAARREFGRKPTNADLKKIWEDGKHKDITHEDIRSALDSGAETLGVYAMKCVGYDEAFQMELVQKFSNWVPPPRKPKGEGRSSKAKLKQSQTSKTASITRKRKREETPESEPPEPESEEDVNPHEDEDGENITSSRRRSRQRLVRTMKLEADVIELSDDEADMAAQPVNMRHRNKGTRRDPIVL